MRKLTQSLFAVLLMLLTTATAWAETGTEASSTTGADKNTAITGQSYTIAGTFNPGGSGNQKGTMARKGLKLRTNQEGNTLTFNVAENYTITSIVFDGYANDEGTDKNGQGIKVTKVEVDGNETDFEGAEFPLSGAGTSGKVTIANISATQTITLTFDNSNVTKNNQIITTYDINWSRPDASQPTITVSPKTVTLVPASTYQLTAKVDPNSFSTEWASDAVAVATVSETGLVTAVAPGQANITLKWTDNAEVADAMVVTVNDFDPANYSVAKEYDFKTMGANGDIELTLNAEKAGSIWNQANNKKNDVFCCTNEGLENIAVQAAYKDGKGWKINDGGLLLGSGAGRCAAICGLKAGQIIELIYTGNGFYLGDDDSAERTAINEGKGRAIYRIEADGMFGFELDKGNHVEKVVIYETKSAVKTDYTDFIVNADLTGEGGFDATGTKGIDGSGIVKCANNAQFDFNQVIANLPAGKYKLTAKAAYRYSGSEADEAAAIGAGTQTKLAKLYATVGKKTVETPVMNRWDGASTTDYAAGDGSTTVNEKYVPNSSNAVKAWFAAGQYVNEVTFNLPADGQVTIGIVKTAQPEVGDYTVIGPWTLTRLGDADAEPEPEPEAQNLIANGDFEGTYSIFASPKDDRDILQPEGWTVTYENGEENDMTALTSVDKAWNNFSGKPQLGETAGKNSYWVRFRWGDSETLTLSQQVTLPAGDYKLSADAFFNGANGASATISAAGQTKAITGNSTWANNSLLFSLNEQTNVTVALNLTQTQQVENIAAFDNVVLEAVDFAADAKANLQAEINAAEALKTDDRTAGLDDFNAAINAAKALLTSSDIDAINQAIETLKAAEQAFIKANMLPNQKYIIGNFASNLYWGAGNDWGTRASLVKHPEYVTLIPQADGTYFMETQVNNGGQQYYFNGDYMDNGSPVKLTIKKGEILGYLDDEETQPLYGYTIANGNNYFGWDGTTTVLGKNLAADNENAIWVIVSLDDAKASLASATADEPIDATFLIEDHDFGRNNRYVSNWTMEAANQNLSGGNNINNCAESYHSTFTLSQTLADAPKGIYSLTAQGFYRQDGEDNENLPVFYANNETQTFPFLSGTENDMSSASASFSQGNYTIEPIFFEVTEPGQLTIGARLENNENLWCIFDNFVLTYYGEEATIDDVKNAAIIAELEDLRDEAVELVEDIEVEAVKNEINNALAATADVTGADAINAAIATMKAAIAKGKAYVTAKNVLQKMKQLTEETNFYTAEALQTYYTQWAEKYEAATLTADEVNALQDPYRNTGWQHNASTTVDDLLLSTWSFGETKAKDYETSLYINTWSVEGDNDGSNFKVPFFEYWTGDGNSLGENNLTATLNGLQANSIYDVTGWFRVRIKNDGGDTAYGIKLVSYKEAYDTNICAGEQIGNSQFRIGEFSTRAKTDANGTMTVKIEVAADNNVSWLSFKNMMYTFKGEATGISTINADAQADGIFNLNGQKVNRAQKGLFIINGNKVVIK